MSEYENTLTIMTGGGWMVTAYWGEDGSPFNGDQIETTPVVAWRIFTRPGARPDDLPDVTADPVWEDQTDARGSVFFPGERSNYVVWHPSSAHGAVSTIEAAEKALRAAHRYPVAS